MIDDLVQITSTLIPVVGGLWAALRYIDNRNRELRERRLQRYSETVREANGLRADGSRTLLVENVAAVYRLLEFEEKRQVSILIVEGMLKQRHLDQMLGGHLRRILDDRHGSG